MSDCGGVKEFDRQERLGRSLIQHGPCNRRIYLMKLHPEDSPAVLERLELLAAEHGYTKIIAKVPAGLAGAFEGRGYRSEAAVPVFYGGGEEALFLAKYPDPARAVESCRTGIEANLAAARARQDQGPKAPLGEGYSIGEAGAGDAAEMAALYRAVFPSYPFPIHEPDYLIATMQSHIRYFCVRRAGRIVALASSEMDRDARNVEMTDFATDREHLGHGLAVHLLARMEHEMREAGMLTAYTIARALSPGMNITFARLGYRFRGTLTNNTDISGAIESMNVWSRSL